MDRLMQSRSCVLSFRFAFLLSFMLPALAVAATVVNPICPDNTALFNPDRGEDIVLPPGFTISVFKEGLNFPTGIAFRASDGRGFEVYVLESGHGLPSRCNDQSAWPAGEFAADNPFTPDILVFNDKGHLLRVLAKPTADGRGLQPEGPAVDVAFENGLAGGRLFASDSNQATHARNGQNNSSRIVTVDPLTGRVTPFITSLPTGTIRPSNAPSRTGGSTGRRGRRPTAASSAETTAAERTSRTFPVRTSCSARTSSTRGRSDDERVFRLRRATPRRNGEGVREREPVGGATRRDGVRAVPLVPDALNWSHGDCGDWPGAAERRSSWPGT